MFKLLASARLRMPYRQSCPGCQGYLAPLGDDKAATFRPEPLLKGQRRRTPTWGQVGIVLAAWACSSPRKPSAWACSPFTSRRCSSPPIFVGTCVRGSDQSRIPRAVAQPTKVSAWSSDLFARRPQLPRTPALVPRSPLWRMRSEGGHLAQMRERQDVVPFTGDNRFVDPAIVLVVVTEVPQRLPSGDRTMTTSLDRLVAKQDDGVSAGLAKLGNYCISAG